MGFIITQIEHLTLREFILANDGYLLSTWDHTSQLSCLIGANTSVLINVNSKTAKARPKPTIEYHPYRKREQRKNVVRDIKTLMYIGDALVGRK